MTATVPMGNKSVCILKYYEILFGLYIEFCEKTCLNILFQLNFLFQAHNNNIVSKGRTLSNRRKSDNHQKQTIVRQRREAAKEVSHRRQKRKERKIVRRKVRNIKLYICLMIFLNNLYFRPKLRQSLTVTTRIKTPGRLTCRNYVNG